MAALTRSGARNASEMVMFTFLVLQLSRLAMLSLRCCWIPDEFIEPTAPTGD